MVKSTYRQYADLIARDIFTPYLADVLDLDKHARHGRLLVVEANGRIRGFGAFYRTLRSRGSGGRPAGPAGARSPSTPTRAGTASRAPCSPRASVSRAIAARRCSRSTRPAS